MRWQSHPLQCGKYDTYKGSTPVEPHSEHNPNISGGNMILIKDRHSILIQTRL